MSGVGSSPCRLPPTLRAALCLSPGSLPTNYELYYGFTRFAVELNELDPVLKDLLPPTDARFRPDQRSGAPQGFCSLLDDNVGVRGCWDSSLHCLFALHAFFHPRIRSEIPEFLPWAKWHLSGCCNRNLLDSGRKLLFGYQMSEHAKLVSSESCLALWF